MPDALVNGVRNIRSSLLSGALLLISIYIFAMGNEAPYIHTRPSVHYLINYHESVPVILVSVFAYLIGSLYTTALEGLVDWFHRKLIATVPKQNDGLFRRMFIHAFCPLSEASRRRLEIESARFFQEFDSTANAKKATAKHAFTASVFSDVLWMEGKLAGTTIRATYNDYRAEGEFRLAVGLLIPIAASAAAYATLFNWSGITIVVLVTLAISAQTCNYGLYYYRRAHSFLAHHVADGALLTPSMETLKRAVAVGAAAGT